MSKPRRRLQAQTLIPIQQSWWEKFGRPVVGDNTQPADRHWRQFFRACFKLQPEVAKGMLAALVFNEDRNLARRGLDALRSHFKQHLPATATLWGRPAAGRKASKFTPSQSVHIALARLYDIPKWEIACAVGIAKSDSSTDRAAFRLIDRAQKQGVKVDSYHTKKAKLGNMSPRKRNSAIMSALGKINLQS